MVPFPWRNEVESDLSLMHEKHLVCLVGDPGMEDGVPREEYSKVSLYPGFLGNAHCQISEGLR